MRFDLILPFLATAATAAGSNLAQPNYYGTLNEDRYPLCPDDYSTYCCMTVVPYTNTCHRGRCKQEYGWSCVAGRGKVDSIRACLAEDDGGRLSAYCKKPGYEFFPSVMSWEGGGFSPMLKPSDYRHWVRPGMQKPWTPSWEEIQWEADGEHVEDNAELRKREPEEDSYFE